MGLPGVFDETIFTSKGICSMVDFIRPMHPKSEIRPTPEAIKKLLDLGWVGQLKIHGHRAQIHLSEGVPTRVFNRQGQLHKRSLDVEIDEELRRIFPVSDKAIVLDGEWLKPEKVLFLFDVLVWHDEPLNHSSYAQRHELLPRVYSSEQVQTLRTFRTVEECLHIMNHSDSERVEGLVFRSLNSKGFRDSSIVRCRKKSW